MDIENPPHPTTLRYEGVRGTVKRGAGAGDKDKR